MIYWSAALLASLALLAGAVYALAEPSFSLSELRSSIAGDGSARGGTSAENAPPRQTGPVGEEKGRESDEEPSSQELRGSPEAAVYTALSPEMPGMEPGWIEGVYESREDPSWASVHLTAPEEKNGDYVVFARRSGGLWEARRSVRADEPTRLRNEEPVLRGVPADLADNRYAMTPDADPQTPPREVKSEDLPKAPAADADDEVEVSGRGEIPDDGALRELEEEVSGYAGVAGVYVQDAGGEWGYGARPDESFFSASVIKVPVMVAVFRRVEQGELSLDESYPTREEDWAAGAGTLQYDVPGESHTLESYLRKMMGESDNVATNALIRLAGGPDYVNSVASDLGAESTLLYQPVTSERAAVPALDNRTTPRDMARMLAAVGSGEAASPGNCRRMLGLLGTNEFEGGIENGLPDDAEVNNKSGWLYKVYNDAAVVEHDGEEYVISIFSKYGPATRESGEITERISEAVWEAQQDDGGGLLGGGED